MIDLPPHKHIESVRIRKDKSSGEDEFLVQTDLDVRTRSAEVLDLCRHVETWQRQQRGVRVTIQGRHVKGT
jgi:hypothetical protein